MQPFGFLAACPMLTMEMLYCEFLGQIKMLLACLQMKQSVDNMSAQLMTIKGGPQSCTTEREVHEKQLFVSALTGQCASINIVVAYSRCSRI